MMRRGCRRSKIEDRRSRIAFQDSSRGTRPSIFDTRPSTFGPTTAAGFTLVELLLVLVVLVLAAAITTPAMLRAYDDYRLKQTAQMVRIELTATRIRAIDTGLAYQFLYEPGGRRFVSVPFELAAAGPQALRGAGTVPMDDLPRESGRLPEGLIFDAPELRTGAAVELPPEYLAGLPAADELASVQWSAPLLFASDGTAQDTGLWLVDQAKRLTLPVVVRGVTGAASAGPVQQEAAP